MKLLLVTSVKEYEKEIPVLFRNSGIINYSASDIKGFTKGKKADLVDNWFSSTTEGVSSVLYFAFTKEACANQLLEALDMFNDTISSNPMRGIVLDVEKFV